jgi:hypothetical protein
MRWVIASLLVLIGASSQSMPAQGQPFVRTIAKSVPMDIYEVVNYTLQCPPGYVPIGYSLTPQYTYDVDEDQGRSLIDANSATIDRNALSSATQLNGGGYALQVFNTEHHAKVLQAMATCLATAASSDNTLQLVKTTGSVAKQTTGTVTSFCPPDSPVAFGGFSNADGRFLQDDGSAPVWGSSGAPVFLNDVPDGATMGPPSGWQVRVFNNLSNNPQVLAFAYCGNGPSVQTFVYSVPVAPASFGFPTAFSIFAPVPDGWTTVGTGYDGGQYGQYSNSDLWMQDGIVVDVLQWYPESTGYDSASAEVRAFMVRGGGTGPSGVPAQAAVAVLVVPQSGAQPAPTTVNITEFYNTGLDHYFITAIPDEIAKLDNGTFQGWARTGQGFKAYGVGSAGRTGRRPVCREYGRPDFGLDSHFYSASPDECMASMANSLGVWGLEASEVFEMDLPDATTGACPAGGVPIYRIWNQRRDSNHRYTTSIATRDQMVAKGGIAEGYGPNAVALCGLP